MSQADEVPGAAVTGDDRIEPDLIVRTALALLPVPEHEPGFWAGLDALLAVEPAPHAAEPALAVGPPLTAPRPIAASAASGAAPGVVASLAQVDAERPAIGDRRQAPLPARQLGVLPPALRRRSNAALLFVALAAAVLILVAGLTLVRQRSAGGLSPLDPTVTTDEQPADIATSTP